MGHAPTARARARAGSRRRAPTAASPAAAPAGVPAPDPSPAPVPAPAPDPDPDPDPSPDPAPAPAANPARSDPATPEVSRARPATPPDATRASAGTAATPRATRPVARRVAGVLTAAVARARVDSVTPPSSRSRAALSDHDRAARCAPSTGAWLPAAACWPTATLTSGRPSRTRSVTYCSAGPPPTAVSAVSTPTPTPSGCAPARVPPARTTLSVSTAWGAWPARRRGLAGQSAPAWRGRSACVPAVPDHAAAAARAWAVMSGNESMILTIPATYSGMPTASHHANSSDSATRTPSTADPSSRANRVSGPGRRRDRRSIRTYSGRRGAVIDRSQPVPRRRPSRLVPARTPGRRRRP
jgi:hypothetical protein